MTSLMVMKIRLLEDPRRLQSLPTTCPQIQRAHNLPAIVLLIHLGFDIGCTASTLLGMQDSSVSVIRSKEELRTNSARVPCVRRVAGLANEMTKDGSEPALPTRQLCHVLVVLVAGIGLASDNGMEVRSFEFLAWSQFALWRRRGRHQSCSGGLESFVH